MADETTTTTGEKENQKAKLERSIARHKTVTTAERDVLPEFEEHSPAYRALMRRLRGLDATIGRLLREREAMAARLNVD